MAAFTAEALAEVLSSGAQDLVTNERLESRLSAQTAEIIKWVAGLLIAQAACSLGQTHLMSV